MQSLSGKICLNKNSFKLYVVLCELGCRSGSVRFWWFETKHMMLLPQMVIVT